MSSMVPRLAVNAEPRLQRAITVIAKVLNDLIDGGYLQYAGPNQWNIVVPASSVLLDEGSLLSQIQPTPANAATLLNLTGSGMGFQGGGNFIQDVYLILPFVGQGQITTYNIGSTTGLIVDTYGRITGQA